MSTGQSLDDSIADRVAALPAEMLQLPPLDPSVPSLLPKGHRILPGCRAHSAKLKELFDIEQPDGEWKVTEKHIEDWLERAGSPNIWVLERFADEHQLNDSKETGRIYPRFPATHPAVGLVVIDTSDERSATTLDIFSLSPNAEIQDFLYAYGADRARMMRLIGFSLRRIVLGPNASVVKEDWVSCPQAPGNLIVRPSYPLFDEQAMVNLWKKIGWGYDEIPSWMKRFSSGEKVVYTLCPAESPDIVCGSLALTFADGEDDPDMCDLTKGLISLSHFAVDPALQGRGLGSWMLAFLHAEVKMLGYSAIALNTDVNGKAWKLYEKCGYVFVKLGQREWTISFMTDVPMEERVARFYRKAL